MPFTTTRHIETTAGEVRRGDAIDVGGRILLIERVAEVRAGYKRMDCADGTIVVISRMAPMLVKRRVRINPAPSRASVPVNRARRQALGPGQR